MLPLDDMIARARSVFNLSDASYSNIRSLKAWLEENPCINELETEYLDESTREPMSISRVKDQSMSGVARFIVAIFTYSHIAWWKVGPFFSSHCSSSSSSYALSSPTWQLNNDIGEQAVDQEAATQQHSDPERYCPRPLPGS